MLVRKAVYVLEINWRRSNGSIYIGVTSISS